MSPQAAADAPVVVVGAGISGIACARVLHDGGRRVEVRERSHRIGGRMAVRTEQLPSGPHVVDIGAGYFTVREPRFAEVVRRWQRDGLAHVWTDTFYLGTPDGRLGTTTGPRRWSSPYGLRRLVEQLAEGLDVRLRCEVEEVGLGDDGRPVVDGDPAAAVVLAMPDPQAADLVPEDVARGLGVAARAWTPELSVWMAWDHAWWPRFDGVFVDGSDVLAFVADDGRRRGDGAPVIVAHTTAEFAEDRLDDVGSAVDPMLEELPKVIGAGDMPDPMWVRVHRWALSAPRHSRGEQFGLLDALIGACGDGWGERSRIEQAWMSGTLLGTELLARLEAQAPARP